MTRLQRGDQGKFALKSDEYRLVRSFRLTDTAWNLLGEIANSQSITRADLIEDWVRYGQPASIERHAAAVLLSLPPNPKDRRFAKRVLGKLIERLKVK